MKSSEYSLGDLLASIVFLKSYIVELNQKGYITNFERCRLEKIVLILEIERNRKENE